MSHLRWTAALVTAALALVAFPLPAAAARPIGTSGPVIHHFGDWYLRTTPSGGVAEQQFHYGSAGDVPLVGDWNGNGSETVGVARFAAGRIQWFLRNSNSAGSADISFTFGDQRIVSGDVLGSIPVVGNFDPSDDAYEVGVVYSDPTAATLTWVISRDLTSTSPTVTFSYGRAYDRPVVGDWNGDGVDTPGVVRDNSWYLTDQALAGGDAQVSFGYGSGRDLPVPGDWNGDGVDTPGVVRDAPGTPTGSYQLWLLRNSNTAGPANTSFTFGGPSLATDFPIETLPRLAIEVS
jgi:hypothetical protein